MKEKKQLKKALLSALDEAVKTEKKTSEVMTEVFIECRKHVYWNAKGQRRNTCQVCGKKKGKTGPKGPHKLNAITVNKMDQAFAIGASIPEACHYAKISRSTYDDWVLWFPVLKGRWEDLQQRPLLKARRTIYDALDDPDVAKWLLERKLKDEFSTKQITSSEGDISEASAQHLARVMQILKINGEDVEDPELANIVKKKPVIKKKSDFEKVFTDQKKINKKANEVAKK